MKSPYERKIDKLTQKYQHNRTLTRDESNRVLSADCPKCEFLIRCMDKQYREGHLRLCIAQSTESDRLWIRLGNDNIWIGDRFGLLIAERPGKTKGRSSWYCLCDCGNLVEVREDHLLDGHTASCGCQERKKSVGQNEPYILVGDRKRKYRRGSQRNPDGTPHTYPSEHSSRIGMSVWVDIREIDGKKKPRIVLCDKCRCPIRTDRYGDKVCENKRCGLIA